MVFFVDLLWGLMIFILILTWWFNIRTHNGRKLWTYSDYMWKFQITSGAFSSSSGANVSNMEQFCCFASFLFLLNCRKVYDYSFLRCCVHFPWYLELEHEVDCSVLSNFIACHILWYFVPYCFITELMAIIALLIHLIWLYCIVTVNLCLALLFAIWDVHRRGRLHWIHTQYTARNSHWTILSTLRYSNKWRQSHKSSKKFYLLTKMMVKIGVLFISP